MNKQRSGFLFALVDMFTYGLLPVFSHYFVVMINPLLFGGLSMIVGAVPLLTVLKRSKTFSLLYKGSHIKKLIGFILLTTLGSIFFFLGASLTSGINTGLLTQIEPLYALILAVLVLKEKITIKQLISVTIMVIGAIVISYRGFDRINVGDILIVTAPLLFQISHIIAKRINLQTNEANLIPTARLLYGGLMLLLISLVIQPTAILEILSFKIIISIVTFGLIFRTLDLWLWYQAINRITPSQASALIPIAGLISFVGSLVILKEQPTVYQYIGLVLILGGLTWYSKIQYFKQQN